MKKKSKTVKVTAIDKRVGSFAVDDPFPILFYLERDDALEVVEVLRNDKNLNRHTPGAEAFFFSCPISFVIPFADRDLWIRYIEDVYLKGGSAPNKRSRRK